jgi:hypothetical protein
MHHRQTLSTAHKAPDNIMIGNRHRLQLPLRLDGEEKQNAANIAQLPADRCSP